MSNKEGVYKVKIGVEELLHLRQFLSDNVSIAKATQEYEREVKWKDKCQDLLTDMRLWPIVASIAEAKEAVVVTSAKVRVKGKDLLGKKQDFLDNHGEKEFLPAVELNREIQMTIEGWNEARPLVQEALDGLQLEYATPYGCGLFCNRGEFWKEVSYVDTDGHMFNMFSMEHIPNPMGNGCKVGFPARAKEVDQAMVWERVSSLAAKRKLILVDGWTKCQRCGAPMRPKV